MEIGPRDMEAGQCVIVRRDNREKIVAALDGVAESVAAALEAVHAGLFEKALQNRTERTFTAKDMEELKAVAAEKSGFIKAMWCGDQACEVTIKEQAGLSSRCIPYEQERISDRCVCCGKPADKMVYWGVAY